MTSETMIIINSFDLRELIDVKNEYSSVYVISVLQILFLILISSYD